MQRSSRGIILAALRAGRTEPSTPTGEQDIDFATERRQCVR